MKFSRLAFAAFLALALCRPAFAHALLKQADPAAGSVLAQAPKSLHLTFSEPVEPAFSSITVTAADGKSVATAKPAAAPGHPTELDLALPDLAAGKYHVAWRAVSVDTHVTHGTFAFTIQPKASRE